MNKRLIVMTDSMYDAISQYQRDNGIRSFTLAMLELVLTGLKSAGYNAELPQPWGGKRSKNGKNTSCE
jgi:hypothetical protein